MREKDATNLISALLPTQEDEPYHVPASELQAYADGEADDVTRELVDTHLEVCHECAEALAKLRAPAVPLPLVAARASYARIAAFAVLAIGLVAIALLAFWAMRPRPAPASAGPEVKPAEEKVVPAPAPAANESPDVASDKANDNVSPSLRKAIQLAWTNQRLEKPEGVSELKGEQGRLLGGLSDGVPFALVSPVGRVVQSRTPALTWRPLAGANSYTVLVVDEKLEEVANSTSLTQTRWTVPVALKRGHTYSWQVTAIKDGQRITSPTLPAPQAKFRVLDQSHADEINRLKQSQPDYHLGLGVLYTHAGMLDEAEQEFEALVKESPSPTATKLLQSIKALKQ